MVDISAFQEVIVKTKAKNTSGLTVCLSVCLSVSQSFSQTWCWAPRWPHYQVTFCEITTVLGSTFRHKYIYT